MGLPFAVFPAATYFQKSMFDEAGLNYPPAKYGDKYVLPGGAEVDWTQETLTNIAKYLTVDENGNARRLTWSTTHSCRTWTSMRRRSYSTATCRSISTRTTRRPSWPALPSCMRKAVGKITASIPDSWQEAWQWWYYWDAALCPLHPEQLDHAEPGVRCGQPLQRRQDRHGEYPHVWYTCCIANVGEKTWDLAVIPTNAEGKVNSPVDAYTYRILKGSQNPEAAFEVMSYLLGPASLDLLTTYGGMPAGPRIRPPSSPPSLSSIRSSRTGM